MVRTLISLDDDDKAWLDEHARELGTPMTQLVREAVALYRRTKTATTQPALGELLDRTAGLRAGRGHAEDGLTTQRRLRGEWDGDFPARRR